MVFSLLGDRMAGFTEIVAFSFGFRKGNYPDNLIPPERSD
jgi:hypothetical protein